MMNTHRDQIRGRIQFVRQLIGGLTKFDHGRNPGYQSKIFLS